MILYFSDAFKKPCRFEPHVVVDIDGEFDRLVDMLHCHESQFYEWLPYNAGYLDQVPEEEAARREWLADRIRQRLLPAGRPLSRPGRTDLRRGGTASESATSRRSRSRNTAQPLDPDGPRPTVPVPARPTPRPLRRSPGRSGLICPRIGKKVSHSDPERS